MLADQAIQCGDADVVVAGGMENMSMAPYYMDKAQLGPPDGSRPKIEDHMVHDGLWDVVNDFHMGISNELCSEKWEVTREDQDRFAAESYRTCQCEAMANRPVHRMRLFLKLSVPQRKGDTKVFFDTDECPQETSVMKACCQK
jgi:acetyl-CoA C-acetyltransferase